MSQYLAVHYYDLDLGDRELLIFQSKGYGIVLLKRVYMDSSEIVTSWKEIIKRVRKELKLAPDDDSGISYECVIR